MMVDGMRWELRWTPSLPKRTACQLRARASGLASPGSRRSRVPMMQTAHLWDGNDFAS